MAFDAPVLSRSEQISWCRERGLISSEKEEQNLISFLQFVNFSTFLGYWAIYKGRTITADKVISDFVADQRLRRLTMEAVERIEVAVRTVWSEHLLESRDPFIYCSPSCFKGTEYHKWFERVKSDLEHQKTKNQRLRHFYEEFRENDFPYPPLWLAVNSFTLGTLSYGVKATHDNAFKKNFAELLGFPRNVSFLEAYLRVLTNVRNVCAHHDKLWNNPVVGASRIARDSRSTKQQTLYPFLFWSSVALRKISPSTTWPTRLATLCTTEFEDWQLKRVMGFPNDWNGAF